MLRFAGAKLFRQRLICSTLSGKAIKIDEIHMGDAKPGLREHEVSFIRFLEKLQNGCAIEIGETGTSVFYRPGVLCGGRVSHDAGRCGRGVGYFLEAAAVLGPFGKENLELTVHGITNDDLDPSADLVRAVLLPGVLARFGVPPGDGLDVRIVRRGAPPSGGGTVVLTCPSVRTLSPLALVDGGLVCRVRGIAYSARASPQSANRMIDGARSVLNPLARDVFVFSDHRKVDEAGDCPGFAIALVAETTTGCLLGAELAASPGDVPEDVGVQAARSLLAEVAKSGCVDTMCQWPTLLLMILCSEDVSKVRLGKLSQHTVDCLRLFREVFGVVFKIDADAESKTVLLSCLGIGFSNVSRRIY